jgi:hypothetical protein
MSTLKWLGRLYAISTYARDIWRAKQDPGPGEGDGYIYVVQDIFDQYISKDSPAERGKGMWMTNALKGARRFYDGQAAWGWATRSIYPALPIRLGPDPDFKPKEETVPDEEDKAGTPEGS